MGLKLNLLGILLSIWYARWTIMVAYRLMIVFEDVREALRRFSHHR